MLSRMLLSDGTFIYPNFLTDDDRVILRNKINEGGISLRCSCRIDDNLEYGISSDLRFYPLHQNYVHAPGCARQVCETRNSAVLYDESGETTIFLMFNPKNFTMPKTDDTPAPDSITTKPEMKLEDETDDYAPFSNFPQKAHRRRGDGLPSFDLYNLIRCINHDTYSRRICLGKQVFLSADYFTSAVIASLKRTRISGLSKPLSELRCETDGLSFFYAPVNAIEDKYVVFRGSKGVYRRFVFENILRNAVGAFEETAGVTISDVAGINLYAAGFRYQKRRRSGKPYTCIGRLCFFMVSENGLFASCQREKLVLDTVLACARKYNGMFVFPDVDTEKYYGLYQNASGSIFKVYAANVQDLDSTDFLITDKASAATFTNYMQLHK